MVEPIRYVPGYNELMHKVGKLTKLGHKAYKAQVNSAFDKGVGYAWGRSDGARLSVPRAHAMDELDFATAYATHVLAGSTTSAVTHDIRTCYDMWLQTGVIV